jgi:hypothetical protein
VIVCTFTTIVPQCNGNESFNLYVEYFFPLLMPRILPDCIYEQHSGCLIFIFIIRNRNCLPLARTCSHPLGFMVGSVLLICFFFVSVFYCVFSSSFFLCSQCCQCLWIVRSRLLLRFSLTFIFVCCAQMVYIQLPQTRS